MLYRLNLILNSNQGLALFRQNQILRPIRHKNLQKHNNEDFFIELLNAWLHFTNNKFPTPISIEEILDQPLFLNPHTKLDFTSDNPLFYRIPPKNISDKLTIIRDICRFLQPGFISYNSFEEKLNLPNTNHHKVYKYIVDLIPSNWKHILRTKTTQESLFKTFYYNVKGIRKVKNLQKLSNKEFYVTLQHNHDNYNKPFKFISWTNAIEGNLGHNFYLLVQKVFRWIHILQLV